MAAAKMWGEWETEWQQVEKDFADIQVGGVAKSLPALLAAAAPPALAQNVQ